MNDLNYKREYGNVKTHYLFNNDIEELPLEIEHCLFEHSHEEAVYKHSRMGDRLFYWSWKS